MPKSNLLAITRRVDDLASEMEKFVPINMKGTDGFRADLAGLLVVTISACYENCVKTTLVEYAAKRHVDFAEFTERNFSRLSSRVKVNDLHGYAKLFGVMRRSVSGRYSVQKESRYQIELGLILKRDTSKYWIGDMITLMVVSRTLQ